MLSWAFLFLIIAIIAEVFGFSGVAGESAWIAHVLFVVFIIMFIVSFFLPRAAASLKEKSVGGDADQGQRRKSAPAPTAGNRHDISSN